jgi:2-polyprenyl-6-methoxyphenol hydroxylase-like FAD-dependent oxidoreductase
VVEVAPELRGSGYPIDVRGPAIQVAERMGLLGRIRELSVDTAGVDFVGDGGRTVSLNMRRLRVAAGVRDLELLRGDLVRTLYEATADDVEYRFGDSVASVNQDERGVVVDFDSGATDRFDVVIGADGLHSNVRRQVFGPETGFRKYLGLYVAGASVGAGLGVPDRCVLYNVPGKAAGVYRFGDTATAIFLFRTAELDYDYRDVAQHKDIVAGQFAGVAHMAPVLRDAVAADDFYFDSVSQIRMPSWSRGRVALAGDAGYGPALLSGSGTTLAMAGAYLLAGELSAGGSPSQAFARYEAALRPMVTRAQRSAGTGGGLLVPATAGAIRRRNAVSRLTGPQWAAARLSRYLPRQRTELPEFPILQRSGV